MVGSTELVDLCGVKNVPAKIDTGADSSSVWVSDLEVNKDGTLSFSLFGQTSELYTGERITSREYSVTVVRSSNGHEQIRYRMRLPLRLGGREIRANFTLASREKNNFPVLIGRKTLKGKFLVDVSIRKVDSIVNPRTASLNEELRADPFNFHQKYFNK